MQVADNDQFLDDYVKDGASGGERAARDLRQAILDHLKDKTYFQHDYKILIRVYANLQGLSKTYSDARIIPNSKVFLDFVQTFNKTHDLVEIVDAGNDKEAADSKIKGTVFLRACLLPNADGFSNVQPLPTQLALQADSILRIRGQFLCWVPSSVCAS